GTARLGGGGPAQRPEHGFRGSACGGPGDDEGGRDPLRGALVGDPATAPQLRRGLPPPRLDGPPLAALAGAWPLPRPSVALVPRALGADPAGPDLRADRRDHRRFHDLAAGDTWGRAQLGLSLLVDPGFDL